MFTLADAYALARTAHAGQPDKMGRDYFTAHLVPISEALRPHGEYAEMAGILHDIIEDTHHTAETLLAAGVPVEVVEAVVSVTRIPGEPYTHLILRAAAHPLGCKVKIQDNRHNRHNRSGNAELARKDPVKAASLRQRYDTAYEVLIAAEMARESQAA